MDRIIPPLDGRFLHFFLRGPKKKTVKNYISEMEKLERDAERSLEIIFAKVGTRARVKTDPYSLVYNHEIVVERSAGPNSNPTAFYLVAREILWEILKEDLVKIRFYMYINLVVREYEDGSPHELLQYSFRYHVPEWKK